MKTPDLIVRTDPTPEDIHLLENHTTAVTCVKTQPLGSTLLYARQ